MVHRSVCPLIHDSASSRLFRAGFAWQRCSIHVAHCWKHGTLPSFLKLSFGDCLVGISDCDSKETQIPPMVMQSPLRPFHWTLGQSTKLVMRLRSRPIQIELITGWGIRGNKTSTWTDCERLTCPLAAFVHVSDDETEVPAYYELKHRGSDDWQRVHSQSIHCGLWNEFSAQCTMG